MDTVTYQNPAQKEALINEIKGHLFEYLVGRGVASHLGLEGKFLCNIPKMSRDRLRDYEAWLRHNDLRLMRELPSLAQKVVAALKDQISSQGRAVVSLCGRRADRLDSLGEADILIDSDSPMAIGLKFCKSDSFVNTKSGGIRSFLVKYFGAETQAAQNRLNSTLDQSFDKMACQLYESAGLDYTGEWDNSWEEQGLSLLPGDLLPEKKVFLLEHYQRVSRALYQEIELLWEEKPAVVVDSLPTLLGFKNRKLIQVICFYRGRYRFCEVTIVDGREVDWKNLTAQLGQCNFQTSSFEVFLEGRTLQIRVKPMNKFHARSLKVNCSVKWTH